MACVDMLLMLLILRDLLSRLADVGLLDWCGLVPGDADTSYLMERRSHTFLIFQFFSSHLISYRSYRSSRPGAHLHLHLHRRFSGFSRTSHLISGRSDQELELRYRSHGGRPAAMRAAGVVVGVAPRFPG